MQAKLPRSFLGKLPGRRDASRDRRDEASASAGFRGTTGTPEEFSAAEAEPGKQSEIFQRNASWSKPLHHARAKADGRFMAVNETPADPLAAVGRAVNSFTARVANSGGFVFNFHP